MISIGRSTEGRDIPVQFAGTGYARLRILVLAGQHGDEKPSSHGVAALTREAATGSLDLRRAHVALAPVLNPDGAERRSRENASGIDLNRDHQVLAAPETRALHRFVRSWRPHLIVDAHSYPPRRRRLLEQGMILCHDVFVETATHPNALQALSGDSAEHFVGWFKERLGSRGFRVDRYTLVREGDRVRHGTLDVRDARNGLALRYGIPTVLLECREPVRGEGVNGMERAAKAVRMALHEILAWSQENAALLTRRPESPGRSVTLRPRYRTRAGGRGRARLDVIDATTGEVRNVPLPGEYRDAVEMKRVVPLPYAYAVPKSETSLMTVLERHGFQGGAPPRPADAPLDDYVLFRADGRSGPALAVHLEPRSQFGLARHPELFRRPPLAGSYPVLRVE